MDFKIEGAMKDSGEDIRLSINAKDTNDAVNKAHSMGILVSHVSQNESKARAGAGSTKISRRLKYSIAGFIIPVVVIFVLFTTYYRSESHSEEGDLGTSSITSWSTNNSVLSSTESISRKGDSPTREDGSQYDYVKITEDTNELSERLDSVAAPILQVQADQIYAQSLPAIVRVIAYNSQHQEIAFGSGFYVRGDGTLVTNYHVIKDADIVGIVDGTGNQHSVAGYTFIDCLRDIAVLVTRQSNTSALDLADSEPAVGEKIYALGSPHGLTNTFSDGIVSGIRPFGRNYTLLQSTAPISPGSSGGPLLNEYGKVVGVNTMQHREGQLLNFAVSWRSIGSVKIRNNLDIHPLDAHAHYWVRQAERIGCDDWLEFAVIEARLGDLNVANKYAELAELQRRKQVLDMQNLGIEASGFGAFDAEFYFWRYNRQLALQYIRLGRNDEAKSLYDQMPKSLKQPVERDVVIAYASTGEIDRAFELASAGSYEHLFTYLLDMYGAKETVQMVASRMVENNLWVYLVLAASNTQNKMILEEIYLQVPYDYDMPIASRELEVQISNAMYRLCFISGHASEAEKWLIRACAAAEGAENLERRLSYWMDIAYARKDAGDGNAKESIREVSRLTNQYIQIQETNEILKSDRIYQLFKLEHEAGVVNNLDRRYSDIVSILESLDGPLMSLEFMSNYIRWFADIGEIDRSRDLYSRATHLYIGLMGTSHIPSVTSVYEAASHRLHGAFAYALVCTAQWDEMKQWINTIESQEARAEAYINIASALSENTGVD